MIIKLEEKLKLHDFSKVDQDKISMQAKNSLVIIKNGFQEKIIKLQNEIELKKQVILSQQEKILNLEMLMQDSNQNSKSSNAKGL